MTTIPKFIPLQHLSEQLAAHRQGQRVVLTNGCFDLLHAGHVRYLQAARAEGELLVVGLNSDYSVHALKGPQRPLNAETERAEVMAALACVDWVTIFPEATADHLIEVVHPDVYVKAGDYTLDSLPEKDTLLRLGIRVAFMPFSEGLSTTGLIARMQT